MTLDFGSQNTSDSCALSLIKNQKSRHYIIESALRRRLEDPHNQDPRPIMKRQSVILPILVVAAMTLQFAACDSNSDDDGIPISAETSAAMSVTVGDVFAVIPLAISEAQLAKLQTDASTLDPAGACPEGGSFSVAGSASATQTSFDLDVEIDFVECNGINGSLALDGGGSFSETSFAFDLILDGTVAGECSLTFDRFRESAVADFNSSSMTLTLDGSFRGACTGEGFTCSFNDVEIDTNDGPSSTLLEQSCRLN